MVTQNYCHNCGLDYYMTSESKQSMEKMTSFAKKVYRVVLQIPLGEVRSYKWVAKEIGRPKSSRAVACALRANPFPLIIPCHRVVYSDGRLGGYRWGLKKKLQLLKIEKKLIERIKGGRHG